MGPDVWIHISRTIYNFFFSNLLNSGYSRFALSGATVSSVCLSNRNYSLEASSHPYYPLCSCSRAAIIPITCWVSLVSVQMAAAQSENVAGMSVKYQRMWYGAYITVQLSDIATALIRYNIGAIRSHNGNVIQCWWLPILALFLACKDIFNKLKGILGLWEALKE